LLLTVFQVICYLPVGIHSLFVTKPIGDIDNQLGNIDISHVKVRHFTFIYLPMDGDGRGKSVLDDTSQFRPVLLHENAVREGRGKFCQTFAFLAMAILAILYVKVPAIYIIGITLYSFRCLTGIKDTGQGQEKKTGYD
jgi:hypothetical protein